MLIFRLAFCAPVPTACNWRHRCCCCCCCCLFRCCLVVGGGRSSFVAEPLPFLLFANVCTKRQEDVLVWQQKATQPITRTPHCCLVYRVKGKFALSCRDKERERLAWCLPIHERPRYSRSPASCADEELFRDHAFDVRHRGL